MHFLQFQSLDDPLPWNVRGRRLVHAPSAHAWKQACVSFIAALKACAIQQIVCTVNAGFQSHSNATIK